MVSHVRDLPVKKADDVSKYNWLCVILAPLEIPMHVPSVDAHHPYDHGPFLLCSLLLESMLGDNGLVLNSSLMHQGSCTLEEACGLRGALLRVLSCPMQYAMNVSV